MSEIKNGKISNILKYYTGLFIEGEPETAFEYSENNKDKGSILIQDKGNEIILPSKDDLDNKTIMSQLPKDYPSKTPVIRNILIQFGTYFIRNDYFKNALDAELSEYDKQDEQTLIEAYINLFDNNILDFEDFATRVYGFDFKSLSAEAQITFNSFKSDNSEYKITKTKSELLELFKHNLFNMISNYPEKIIYSPDFLTEVAISQMSSDFKIEDKITISDSRLYKEELAIRNIYPNLNTFVIIPTMGNSLKMKNLEDIMPLYKDAVGIEDFCNKLEETKLVMGLEEYSTLLMIHYFYKNNPSILNKAITKDFKNLGLEEKHNIVLNHFGKFNNLFDEATKIYKTIKENKYTLFSSISGGGKDTILSFIPLFEEGINKYNDLDKTLNEFKVFSKNNCFENITFEDLKNSFLNYLDNKYSNNPKIKKSYSLDAEIIFSSELKSVAMSVNNSSFEKKKLSNKTVKTNTPK